jgi:predicted dehydrogenase
MKVRGQYHLSREYKKLPPTHSGRPSVATVGIIGCGNFAFATIAYYLRQTYGAVLRGAMDIDINRAASLCEAFDMDYYTDDATDVLDDDQTRLIYIASNHASHAEYAIQALDRGKHVHIEKPHVVTESQLERLVSTMHKYPGRTSLGFNRPNSPLGLEVKRRLDAESGSAMFNWFVAGHELPTDHWYYDAKEGGRVLGNLCHWTDFVYYLMDCPDRYPLRIVPARAIQSDCDIAVSYVFGDGSIASITFSAKGHTFEGVRERFSAHKGNILMVLEDFRVLVIEDRERRDRVSLRFRDHGHRRKICDSFQMAHGSDNYDLSCTPAYVWETADMFLSTRRALEENREIVLEGYPFGNG